MLRYNIMLPAMIILIVVHPIMYIPVIYAFYHYRGKLGTEVDFYFEKDHKWYLLFPLSIYFTVYISTMPLPFDDMLRHVISYQFDYDYKNIFLYSPDQPTINLWIGTEIIAGKLTGYFGKEISIRILQYTTIFIFISVFIKATHKLINNHTNKWLIVTVLILVALSTTISIRLTAARPELYSAIWLMAAIFLNPIIWTIIGIILIPTYWLMPIYISGVLLLNTSLKNKIIISILLIVLSLAFWLTYSNDMYIDNLMLISTWFENRIFGVGENKSILFQIINISIFIIIAMLFISMIKTKWNTADTKKIIEITLVLIIFLIPNMTRYLTTIIPLIIFIITINLKTINFKIENKHKLIIIIIAIFIAKDSANMTGKIQDQRVNFILPERSRVLTEFNDSLFSTIYHNPNIKIAPAMEIGATEKGVQQLIMDISINHSLNCFALRKYNFTHLIEGSLNIKGIPDCIKLIEINGKWRLWEII